MVKTYSPKNMVITVNGVQITGFSDDDMVTVALDEANWAKYKSVDGEVSRSQNVGDAGSFTFSLNQTSDSNRLFSNLLRTDNSDSTGSNVIAVAIRDNNSTGIGTYYIATKCWIEGMPESTFGKEIETREWIVQASEIKWNIEGNGESSLQGVASSVVATAGSL